MPKIQRIWMIEGSTDYGWWTIPGQSYDNKRLAFRALKSVRLQHRERFPDVKFRLTEFEVKHG